MYAFRCISDTIQNIVTSSPRSATTGTLEAYSDPPSPTAHQPSPSDAAKESIRWSSFSVVDDLIARSLAYESENWDLDVSDIVQSIELGEDNTQHDTNGVNEDEADGIEAKPRDGKDIRALEKKIDLRGKYEQQLADAKQLAELGWSNDTILAYLKIARRGYEPIIPPSWKHDFPKFPELLFAQIEEDAFIKPLKKSNFAAIHAFDNFCLMGQSVRLSEYHHTWVGRNPENMIKKHLNDYLKWAWADAGLTKDIDHGRIPCLIKVVKRPDQRTDEGATKSEQFEEMEAKTKAKLKAIAESLLEILADEEHDEEHDGVRNFLIEPPTLFGLVIFDTLVALVAYEPLTDQLRAFAFYHFNKMHEEVWNCISLAVLISWVRNSMLRVKEVLLERGALMDIESRPQPDPDA